VLTPYAAFFGWRWRAGYDRRERKVVLHGSRTGTVATGHSSWEPWQRGQVYEEAAAVAGCTPISSKWRYAEDSPERIGWRYVLVIPFIYEAHAGA